MVICGTRSVVVTTAPLSALSPLPPTATLATDSDGTFLAAAAAAAPTQEGEAARAPPLFPALPVPLLAAPAAAAAAAASLAASPPPPQMVARNGIIFRNSSLEFERGCSCYLRSKELPPEKAVFRML